MAERSELGTMEICARCGAGFSSSTKRDFFGFREVKCPRCNLDMTPPLKWWYRITYWLFLFLLVFTLDHELLEGHRHLRLGDAGAFLLLSYLLWGILKDLRIIYHRWTLRPQPSRQ